jgi:hemerythrin-like domain-containing protein
MLKIVLRSHAARANGEHESVAMIADEGRAASTRTEGSTNRPDPPARVVDRLIREHDNVAQLLVVLDSMFASIASGDDADDDLISDAMNYLTGFVDTFHHTKEDLAVAAVAERVDGLRELQPELDAQHRRIENTGSALHAELERMLLDEPVRRKELAATGFLYTAEIRRNIEFEESRIFPRLLEGLDEEAWACIDARLGCPPDPLFGPAPHERYRALFRTLTRRIGIDSP